MTNRMNSFFKRSVLALVAGMVALTFAQTGYTQAPCLISRGLDPLDVLNSGVRHNVWIVLDHSGSMDNNIPGEGTKMAVATSVLTEVMTEFVDASGRPLLNWGYVQYARNSTNSGTACDAQFSNSCVGLALGGMINPPACDEPSTTGAIIAGLPGPKDGTGSTPNGISMDQISNRIVADGFVANLLPNQKNYIILVTDGDDTCECRDDGENSATIDDGVWSPTASPPFASTSIVPRSLRGGDADSSYTIADVGTDGPNIQAVNAGTKGRLAFERLNPTAADRASGAKGGSFVIGLGLRGDSPARAHHMAWEASGAFYANPNGSPALLADNRAGLKKALFNAFARIGVPTAEVSLGPPVVGSVREVIPFYTNTSLLTGDHVGDVGPGSPDQDDIRDARKVRGNHRDNVLFSSSVEVPGFNGHFRAHSIFTVSDPDHPRTERFADFRQIWDAGEILQTRSASSRNLLFNRRGETLLRDFTTANVTAADLGVGAGFLREIDNVGALTADDARDMVVQVIRGYRLSKDSVSDTLYKTNGDINFSEFEADGVTPTWKLRDSVAGAAVMPHPTRSPDFDPTQNHATKYGVGGSISGDGFYWDHFNRQTMVYLPSNGGILHGFDGETGEEVFGYLPDDVLGLDSGETPGSRDTLADLVQLIVGEDNGSAINGIANHQFFLSGSPTVGDVFLRGDLPGGDDEWHSMLTFGRGRGGRFVTGLDVTDPLNPKLQFNVGNREGIDDNELDGMGETWSTPVIGNVLTDAGSSDADRIDQWVVFMGGGYGCDNINNEGQYLFAIRLEDGSIHYAGKVTNDASAVIPYNALVAMPRLFNPHEEDTSDSNDYVTRVYIGDLQGRIWKLVTNNENPNQWTLDVFAEIGIDQPITAPVSLVPDPYTKHVYVMAGTGGDQRVDATVADFKFVGLLDTDVEGDNNLQYASGSSAEWELTLNPEERVYVAPAVIGQIANQAPPIVFFAASRPTFDPVTCDSEFFSSLWAVEIFGGLAYVDLDGTGVDDNVDLGQSKVTGIYARGSNLYVSESGGLGSAGNLTVYGDGEFEDGPTGGGGFSIQVLVDGFRMSPF